MTPRGPRGAVERRNAIVPQMRDYDALGERQRWVPHLMYFHPAQATYPSVTTDARGLRTVVGADPDRPTALLVGGSTAFGIGATSDAASVASRLSATTRWSWRNYGGRALNSTQEAVLTHLMGTDDLAGPIVLLSGLNNLVRACMPGAFDPTYGAFFQQSHFERQMRVAAVGTRALARMLVRGLAAKAGIGRGPWESDAAAPRELAAHASANYDPMLHVLRRDLEYFAMVAAARRTSCTFVLQPYAPWIAKALDPRERELFALLDEEGADFTPVAAEVTRRGDAYRRDVARICADAGVAFVDANAGPAFAGPDWLFVDRLHLTDAGQDAAARLIASALPR